MNWLAILSYICLSVAIYAQWECKPLTIGLLIAALLVTIVGCSVKRWRGHVGRWFGVVLALGAVLSFYEFVSRDLNNAIGHYRPTGFTWSLRIAALATLTYFWPQFRWPNIRLFILFALFLFTGAMLIPETAHPEPWIDVWHFQQKGNEELMAGRNPYAKEYQNIYYPDTNYYGPKVVTADDQRIISCPYPPFSLLLALPGYLCGDVRWSILAAMAGSALLLVLIGRRLGLPAGHPIELIAVLLLFRPSALLMLGSTWTEPLLALMAGFAGLALASGSRIGLIFAAAGLAAVKQYGIFCLPALAAVAPLRWRDWLWAAGLAALVALPFAIWDFSALWRGVVLFQIYQPFREDSVSVLAIYARETGARPSSAIGFIMAGLIALVVVWRAGGRAIVFPVGSTAILLAFFLFNKQAFINYFWFVSYLAAMGAVFAAAPSSSQGIHHAR